jgi:hypothetical protein
LHAVADADMRSKRAVRRRVKFDDWFVVFKATIPFLLAEAQTDRADEEDGTAT